MTAKYLGYEHDTYEIDGEISAYKRTYKETRSLHTVFTCIFIKQL